jgi:opacity protein-like surface antigen
MKKLLLIAVLAIVGLGTANAQDIKFGAKAGINLANGAGDVEEADTKLGLHIGGFAEFMLSEKFAFQPELLYSMQGYKYEYDLDLGDGTSINVEEKIKLDYINLPLIFKFYVTEGLAIEAGPQVGFLVSAKAEFEGGGESEEEDIDEGYNSLDYGVNGGLSYTLDMGVMFGARYYYGIADIDDVSDDFDEKNSVIQVSVGYKF